MSDYAACMHSLSLKGSTLDLYQLILCSSSVHVNASKSYIRIFCGFGMWRYPSEHFSWGSGKMMMIRAHYGHMTVTQFTCHSLYLYFINSMFRNFLVALFSAISNYSSCTSSLDLYQGPTYGYKVTWFNQVLSKMHVKAFSESLEMFLSTQLLLNHISVEWFHPLQHQLVQSGFCILCRQNLQVELFYRCIPTCI